MYSTLIFLLINSCLLLYIIMAVLSNQYFNKYIDDNKTNCAVAAVFWAFTVPVYFMRFVILTLAQFINNLTDLFKGE